VEGISLPARSADGNFPARGVSKCNKCLREHLSAIQGVIRALVYFFGSGL